MYMKISDIILSLKIEKFTIQKDVDLDHAVAITELNNNGISFISDLNILDIDIEIYEDKYSIDNLVVLHELYLNKLPKRIVNNGNFIYSKNPRLTFTKIFNLMFPRGIQKETIIGFNLTKGENCTLKNCIIGNNVKIHSGTIIGEDGFGYVREENNNFKFPHIGMVIIENNVEIHSNVCIDRGSLSNTIIRRNCKIDNLVHIAHNVEIGENTFVIANSMIGGSVKIGRNCWISPGSIIRDRIKIGDNVIIGMGSVVTKDVPSNEIWYGSPAKKMGVTKL